MADSNAAYIVDLSDNNAVDGAPGDGFDAATYATAGHRGVVLKATQGASYVDLYVHDWANAAHAAKLGVAFYHFADNTATAEAQAAHFLETIKPLRRQGELVVLDIEQGSMIDDPVTFRQQFEAALSADVRSLLVVYSDAGFFEQYGEGLRPDAKGVWVAAYPTLPAGWWTEYLWAHQSSQTGNVHGIAGPCDLSQLAPAAIDSIAYR